jgi:ubiquinone/menaquinone biosynthesis C-methylase UbiE
MKNEPNQIEEVSKWWNLDRNAEKWDKAYESGGMLNRMYLKERSAKVVAHLGKQGIGPGCKVLDLGYGAGQSSLAISELGCAVYGMDIGEGLCAKAKARVAAGNPQGEFHLTVGNLEEKFPYEGETFDAAVVVGAMQYLTFTDVFLSEVYRVLKPGAVFVVAQRNIYSLSNMTTPRGFLRTVIHALLREPYELQLSLRSILLDSRLGKIFNPLRDSRLLTNRIVMRHHQEMKFKIKKRKNSYFTCKRELKSKGFEVTGFDGAFFPLIEDNRWDRINGASHRVINWISRFRGTRAVSLLGRSFIVYAKKAR